MVFPHLGFPVGCCCLLAWILMAPLWAMRGEPLGDCRGEIRGEERDAASGGWGCAAAAEGLAVRCFLGMRLIR